MTRKVRELNDRKTGLKPAFQFSISTLLILIAVVAISILVLRDLNSRFGPAVTAVVVLAILSIFAHVAGAVIGGKLRSSEEVRRDQDGEDDEVESRLLQPTEAQQSDFAPTTQLSKQKPLNRQPLYYAVGFGAFFSSVIASIVLVWFMWDNLAIANVLFGALSAAVIGGLFGFWVGILYQVARNALREAQEDTN